MTEVFNLSQRSNVWPGLALMSNLLFVSVELHLKYLIVIYR